MTLVPVPATEVYVLHVATVARSRTHCYMMPRDLLLWRKNMVLAPASGAVAALQLKLNGCSTCEACWWG